MDQSLAIERTKVIGNVASVLITVAVGTYGVAVLNSDFQNRQLEQLKQQNAASLDLQIAKSDAERRQAEMKYLGDYVQFALDADIAKRIRFAEYFATLTISDDLKLKWGTYRDHLIEIRDQEEKLREGIALAAKRGEIDRSSDLQTQLSKLQPQVDSLTPKGSVDNATLFQSIRTDELRLSREGERTFMAGDYAWTIKFLEQARIVQSSGVWQSSYPYLVGAYLATGESKKAKEAADAMLSTMKSGQGYLSHESPQGFVLRSLGDVRQKLPAETNSFIDQLIDNVINIKSSLPPR